MKNKLVSLNPQIQLQKMELVHRVPSVCLDVTNWNGNGRIVAFFS